MLRPDFRPATSIEPFFKHKNSIILLTSKLSVVERNMPNLRDAKPAGYSLIETLNLAILAPLKEPGRAETLTLYFVLSDGRISTTTG